MGHEYMELKNTSAAIQAYRHAIGQYLWHIILSLGAPWAQFTLSWFLCTEVNRRDYRAWYGLGQTYEILKMPLYCLYYYRKAQTLR